MMTEDIQKNLKDVIVQHQFVNCYSPEFSPGDRAAIEAFLVKLRGIHKRVIYIDLDSLGFEQCQNEEEEANLLLGLIGKERQARGLGDLNMKAISITSALRKWSETLNERILLVLHFFHDLYSEKQKNILRSIRRTCPDRSKLSAYLRILMVSNRRVLDWELYPESNLDDRFVKFFEC